MGAVTFLNRFGRAAGRLETIQPVAHLCFLADRPFLVGAAAFGMLVGVEILASRTVRAAGASHRLARPPDVERRAADGQRRRRDDPGQLLHPRNSDGSTSRAATRVRTTSAARCRTPFPTSRAARSWRRRSRASWRSSIRRATFAGAPGWPGLRSRSRSTRWADTSCTDIRPGRSSALTSLVPDPARAARLRRGAEPRAAGQGPSPRTSTGSVRRPDWTVPAVSSDEQAETAVLAVTEDPADRGGFHQPPSAGALHGRRARSWRQGPDMSGVGRILRTAPGWLAAATDRQIVLYDLRRNTQRRLDVSLVELTHLAIRPDSFGLALVQERDRIGRVTPSGRWVWKHELQSPVEDLAIGPGGLFGVHHQRWQAPHLRPCRRAIRGCHVRRHRPSPAPRGSRGDGLGGRLDRRLPASTAGHRSRPPR